MPFRKAYLDSSTTITFSYKYAENAFKNRLCKRAFQSATGVFKNRDHFVHLLGLREIFGHDNRRCCCCCCCCCCCYNDIIKTKKSGVNFYQHSKRSFYVRKLRALLLCAYVLGLYFTGVNLLAQKLPIKRWLNWAQVRFWMLSMNVCDIKKNNCNIYEMAKFKRRIGETQNSIEAHLESRIHLHSQNMVIIVWIFFWWTQSNC